MSTDLERLRINEKQRRQRRRKRRWPFVLLGLIVIGVALMILMSPPEVTVATARVGGGIPAEAGGAVLTANGYVEARHQTSVAARTTGRVAELLVEEGDQVEEGQVVARLIDDDERAQVRLAEAALAQVQARLAQAAANEVNAERRMRRRAELFASQAISAEENEAAATEAEMARSDRVAAEANVKAAEADLAAARLELEKTRITAPFSGVVLRKDAEVGEIVGPIMVSSTSRAGAVVTIADLKTLEVGVDVSESYISRLSVGMPADVVLDAHPDVHFPAEVRTIFPSADRDRATIPIRVRFLHEDPRIRPDLGAKVTFLQRRPTTEITTVPRTVRIPKAAIQEKGAERIAWVVREGKVAPEVVTLGTTTVGEGGEGGEGSEEVEVLSGLSEGDQVVLNAPGRLRKDMRVRLKAS